MDRLLGYFSESDNLEENKDHVSIIKEEYFTRLIEYTPAIIYTCDTKGRITYYNKAAAAFWGGKPELGKDFYHTGWTTFTIEGTPLPIEKTPIAMALTHQKSFCDEIILETESGKRFYVECNPKPIFNTSGKMIGLLNFCIDFSKHYTRKNNL
ncbi:PAS domain-containing protein [Flavobacterium arcticum]|uniref:PAS domain-containing protein n=1 Tax=Flavobacterium arcticum TaxID=1784713 RepID=A0A345HDD4_9FLAO|nr:PAS domain-containing protein [Flavobacterium arcticum]AXG74594.1 PAS domain-containing protein [Flavobacterium arcticum]KAF2512285.1 PAS domain-containing protein [Flavobacterium arcticum]